MANKENTKQEVSEENIGRKQSRDPDKKCSISFKTDNLTASELRGYLDRSCRALKKHIKRKGWNIREKDIDVYVEECEIKLVCFYGGIQGAFVPNHKF